MQEIYKNLSLENLPGEIWCNVYIVKVKGVIYDFSGNYQVSNLGRVKSFYRNKETIMSQQENEQGRLFVGLRKGDIKKTVFVSRLVATYFVFNCNMEEQDEVDHINTNIKDNRASNLRWTDRSGNMRNPLTLEKLKNQLNEIRKLSNSPEAIEKLRNSLKTSEKARKSLSEVQKNHRKKVKCITTGKIFNSIKEASKYYNIKSRSIISECCKGKRKSGGKLKDGTPLTWEYYEK